MTRQTQQWTRALIIAGAAAIVASGLRISAQAPAAQAPAGQAPAGRGAGAAGGAGRGAATAPEAIVANSYPNPYTTIVDYFKMPAGRTWGSTAGIDIDKDGKSIWIIDRCGGNSCYDAASGKMSDLDPILHFDESGKLIKSFGAGMIVFPHGLGVDREGNVWVTDGNDNAPRAARGAAPADGGAAAAAPAGAAPAGRAGGRGGRGAGAGAAGAAPAGAGAQAEATPAPGRGRGGPVGAAAGATKGHQVFKFSPDGKLLMTIGVAGGAVDPECCYQPNDVLVAPNGDIFVATMHGAGGGWIYKYDKTGKLIMKWGRAANGTDPAPGELNQPHSLAMDSRGRLIVGSRSCNCVQIFDQSGKFIEQWTQFSRPSGVFVDKDDNLYVADSESGASNNTTHPGGWQRGIRIGSVRDGKVKYFIPDPDLLRSGTSSAEGVAVDAKGNVYGAEVGQRAVKKYVRVQ